MQTREQWEIKNLSGEVIWTGVGKNLSGANLRGADLGGLRIVGRSTRSDGYEYFAWTSILGGRVIRAGCRTWVGANATEQARYHTMTETDEKYRAEALRIIRYLEMCYEEEA